jgi:hypothetical protein
MSSSRPATQYPSSNTSAQNSQKSSQPSTPVDSKPCCTKVRVTYTCWPCDEKARKEFRKKHGDEKADNPKNSRIRSLGLTSTKNCPQRERDELRDTNGHLSENTGHKTNMFAAYGRLRRPYKSTEVEFGVSDCKCEKPYVERSNTRRLIGWCWT